MRNITPHTTRWYLWGRDALYLVVHLLISPWLIYRSLKRWSAIQEPLQRLRQRVFGISNQHLSHPLDPARPIAWLHGVSVGEVQLLIALQRRIAVEMPEVQCVLSATTPSGMELARKQANLIDCFYFPCDFSWAVQRTLSTVRPKLLILGELEIWPNLIDTCRNRGVKILVVNGRLSDSSFRGYQRFARWTAPIFGKLSHVTAQTATYADRFRQCGCPPARVSVSGNLKFDNVSFDRAHPRVTELRRLIGLATEQRLLVLGSSQEPEEVATVEAFLQLRQEFPELRLIVVPRHPDRFNAAYNHLSSRPAKVIRRSQLCQETPAKDWEILLVDTVGELQWWWGLAEIAIVGGSFGDRGGQNMLEPAGYGANVAFGPNTSNFRDIVHLLLEHKAATRLAGTQSIRDWLRTELQDPERGRLRGRIAHRLIEEQQGATQATLRIIQEMLDTSVSPVDSARAA